MTNDVLLLQLLLTMDVFPAVPLLWRMSGGPGGYRLKVAMIPPRSLEIAVTIVYFSF